MSNKSLTIAFIVIVVITGAAIGTVLGLRARRARTIPPVESPQAAAPALSDDSYLPSSEYVEARARAFKQLREEQLKAQFSRMNSNKSGVPYSY